MTYDGNSTGESKGTGNSAVSDRSLLIVGPTRGTTGGIASYIAEQCRRLPSDIHLRTHDTGAMGGSRSGSAVAVAVRSVANTFRFPFRTPPDLLHVHTSEAVSFYRNAFYVLFAALVWRCPVVLHVHGPTFDRFVTEASPFGRFVQQRVFAASDAIVVLSEHWRTVLEPIVKSEKLRIIPNAVDPDLYAPTTTATVDRTDENCPHVVFLADHIRRKGVTDFVAAIDSLSRDDVEDFRVTIAGKGPLSACAVAVAERHPHVEYRGYVSEDEKRRLLCAASIFVLPTRAEGLPIGILEAMAAGTAVVSTSVGAITSVVDEETGIIVDPAKPTALTDALACLIAAPERTEELGERGRERIEVMYTWQIAIERLVQLYDDILRQPTPPP